MSGTSASIGDRAITLARAWLGTPYLHQASTLGAGTDCLGLVRGIWRGLYGVEPEVPPVYTADWDEVQREEVLWRAALRHLIPVDGGAAPELGEVMLFRMRAGSVAKHLGVRSTAGPVPRMIHAYSGHGVVETSLSAPWQRRVVARFRFPEEIS